MKKNSNKSETIKKIVVNVGIGKMSQQPNFEEKVLPELTKEISLITGQKPAITKAKKSIAGFKTREGQTVGLKVTLRRQRMLDFLERLNKIVLPRLRDFRGINLKSVDNKGNLNIGLREQMVFPEINPESSRIDFGLEITIVGDTKNREEAIQSFRNMGIPLKK